jgi:hypothetical protein
LTLCHFKTIQPIKTKFDDYVEDANTHGKIGFSLLGGQVTTKSLMMFWGV